MYKLSTLVLLITIICSCKGKTDKDINKTNTESSLLIGAPIKQIDFVNMIDSAAYGLSISNNDYDKRETVKELYINFRSYVKISLKDSFEKWNARVMDIKNGDDEHHGVILSLYISTHQTEDGQSIHFNCFVPNSNTELIKEIRALGLNEKVLISGKFDYKNALMIKMQSTSGDNSIDAIFNSPEFFVILTEIKKSATIK